MLDGLVSTHPFSHTLAPSQSGSPRPDLLGNVESDEELCDVLIGRLPRQPPGPHTTVGVHRLLSGPDALLKAVLNVVGFVQLET
jgi:hypothetical protein